MYLPKDPNMLVSVVNMKLRDEFSTLDDLCGSLGINRADLERTLGAAGYNYQPDSNSFR